MPLREEWEHNGNWLFRWRSYLPLLLFGLALAGLYTFHLSQQSEFSEEAWEISCMGISFLGLGVRGLTIGFKPKGTSGGNTREQEAAVLNTTGTYSVVRHPLYLGNAIIWLGVSLFFHSWAMTLIVMLAFWIYYERIMFAEEEFLRNKFGEAYIAWASKTPAFIPRLGNWTAWGSAFSWKKVLGKEYAGFFGIIGTFCFLEIVQGLCYEHKLELEQPWRIILFSGALIYLIIRILKKYTHKLDVEGR